MSSDQTHTTAALDSLRPGEWIDISLPTVSLGRRVAYQRIQRDAHAAYGAGGYTMRASGCIVQVQRKELGHD